MAALLEGLRALSATRVLDDVLALVMDSAITVSGAERGFIMLANDDGALDLKMARSRGRQTLPGSGFKTSRKIPEEVFRTGRTRFEANLLDGDLADAHVGHGSAGDSTRGLRAAAPDAVLGRGLGGTGGGAAADRRAVPRQP